MVRIPQAQERLILEPNVADTGESAVIGSAVNALQTGLSVAAKFKQAKDTVKVNEESNRFQLEAFDALEDFKSKRSEDPENFSADFNEFLKKKKESFLKESDLSFTAKSSLSRVLDNSKSNFELDTRKTERQMMVNSFAESIDNVAAVNEELAYRSGKNLDFVTMDKIDVSIESNLIAGATIVDKKELNKMRKTQITRSYSNFVKGIASEDPIRAIKMLDESKLLQSKLNLEERDKLKKYARAVKKQKDEIDKDPTQRNKTFSKAATIENNEIKVKSELDNFKIGQDSKGNPVVKNKNVNSIQDIIEFRNDVKQTYENGNLTKTTYIKSLADTNTVMIEMMNANKIGFKAFFGSSASEQIVKDLNNVRGKDTRLRKSLSDGEYVGVYEDTIGDLIKEGIDPKSTNSKDKKKTQDFFKTNLENAIQLRTGRSDANQILTNNSLVPLNSEASRTEGVKLDNGWDTTVRLKKDGKLYNIRWKRDSQGRVNQNAKPEKFEEVR